MTVDKAAAIRYKKGQKAPFLLCKGRKHMAEKLIRAAEKFNIPLVKNSELLEELIELEPMEAIPEELFEAVAEILAFVYSQEGRMNL